jgi:hypothetical protein
VLRKTTDILHKINELIALSTWLTWIFVFVASIGFYFFSEVVIQSERSHQTFTIFEYTLDKGINVSTQEKVTVVDGAKSSLIIMGSTPVKFMEIGWEILKVGASVMPHIALKIIWYIIGIIPAFWGGLISSVLIGIVLLFKYMFINGFSHYLLGYLIPWSLFALPVVTYPLTYLEESLKKKAKTPA